MNNNATLAALSDAIAQATGETKTKSQVDFARFLPEINSEVLQPVKKACARIDELEAQLHAARAHLVTEERKINAFVRDNWTQQEIEAAYSAWGGKKLP